MEPLFFNQPHACTLVGAIWTEQRKSPRPPEKVVLIDEYQSRPHLLLDLGGAKIRLYFEDARKLIDEWIDQTFAEDIAAIKNDQMRKAAEEHTKRGFFKKSLPAPTKPPVKVIVSRFRHDLGKIEIHCSSDTLGMKIIEKTRELCSTEERPEQSNKKCTPHLKL